MKLKEWNLKFCKLMKCIVTFALIISAYMPINAYASNETILKNGDDDGIPVITSVKMDKAGQILHTGDVVHFSIEAKDESCELSSEGSLTLYSPAISHSFEVDLYYQNETGIYEGIYEVEEDIYGSEWYIEDIEISDVNGNWTNSYISGVSYERDYYFYVEQNGKIDIPTYTISIMYRYTDEEGNQSNFYQYKDSVEVKRRDTFREANIQLATEAPSIYQGLTLLNWVDYEGDVIEEDSEIIEDNLNILYANYDKTLVKYKYNYPNEDSKMVCTDENTIIAEKGSTYYEVIGKDLSYIPQDIYKEEDFSGWQNYKSLDEKVDDFDIVQNELDLYADFYNTIPTVVEEKYYNSDGKYITNETVHFYDKGITYGEWIEMEENSIPKLFEGLRFSHWELNDDHEYEQDEILKNDWFNYIYLEKKAVYENCIVTFALDDEFSFIFDAATDTIKVIPRAAGLPEYDPWVVNSEYFNAITVEKGDTISIIEPEGYENVRYCNFNTATIYDYNGLDVRDPGEIVVAGDEVEINEDTVFIGIGDKIIQEPEDPLKLSKTEVNEIMQKINLAAPQTVIDVDMDDAVIIPKEILSAAKDKNVNLTLNMNGYQWNIVGNTIMENAEDVNLEVLLNINNIPSDIIAGIADNQESIQLSLTYEGEFGFEAWLSLNMGKENVGKVGSLYYYDGESLNYQSSNRIDEDGVVSFKFNHASDYVIITDVQKNNVRKQLTSLIEKAEAIEAEIYTEDSYLNLQRSIAKADEILANLNSTVDQINAAYNQLDNAINKLEKVELNFDLLKQEIILVEKIVDNIDDYIPSTVVDLEKLLNDAKVILSNAMNQEEIDATTKTLREARLKATLICDKKALLEALDEAYALEKEDFTKDSWALYEKEVKVAQTVADDETVSQDEVDKAVTVLVKAKDLLVKRGNTSELSALIRRVETLNSEVYTANTWKLVESALKDAKEVLANADNVSNAEVKEAEESLKNAVNNLVLIDNEKPETDDSNKPNQGNTDKDDTNESEENSELEKNDSTETSATNNIGGYIVAIAFAGATIEVLRRRKKISK